MKFRPTTLFLCLPLLLAGGWPSATWFRAAPAKPATEPLVVTPTASGPQDPKVDNLWRDDPGALIDSYLARAKLDAIEVMLLGTFHFDDQGLDEYKPQHHFDVLDAGRQQEVAEVVAALAKFAPDLICVERLPTTQAAMDAGYQTYLAGDGRKDKNEITQIAFRLAQQLEHSTVYAIDAPARGLEPQVDAIAWAKQKGQLRRLATPLQQVQVSYLADRERFIDRADLATILRFMNHPKVLETSHAGYLVGDFHAADGVEYPGPDGFVTTWHNRNLRIFANLRRVAKPGQRVLVLIGSGHVPILSQCVRSSPEFRLLDVASAIPATSGVRK